MNILTWLKRHIRFKFYIGQPKNIDEIVKKRNEEFTKRVERFRRTYEPKRRVDDKQIH